MHGCSSFAGKWIKKGKAAAPDGGAAFFLFDLIVLFYHVDRNSSAIYFQLYLYCFVGDAFLGGLTVFTLEQPGRFLCRAFSAQGLY